MGEDKGDAVLVSKDDLAKMAGYVSAIYAWVEVATACLESRNP
jgi:hypothetical protein